MNDGSTIIIPKTTASEKLDVIFGNTESINVLPGKTYEIAYTIIGADKTTQIEVIAQDLYKASVSPTDYQSGKIIVKTPSDNLEASRILVFVSKGTNTIMRIINFVESVIIVSTDTVEIASEGGAVQVEVETNVAYTVEIPESDSVWLSVADTRAATHTETLTFIAQANPNTTYRYSTVNLKDDSGLVAQSILLAQKASGYKTIHVETAGTLENYISANEKEKLIGLKLTGRLNAFDYDFMRTMPILESVDLAQIDNTTIPASCFKYSKIKTVILPLNLEAIPDNAFYGSAITSISIPKTVRTIGHHAFCACYELGGTLDLPEGLLSIGDYAFAGEVYTTNKTYSNKLVGNLIIPDYVTSIGKYAFYSCTNFNGTITIGAGLTEIPDYAFAYCTGLKGNLNLSGIIEVGTDAFYECSGFIDSNLILGKSIEKIGKYAFSINRGARCPFNKVYCQALTPPECNSDPFGGSSCYYLGVPIGCKDTYAAAEGFRVFSTIEEIEF